MLISFVALYSQTYSHLFLYSCSFRRFGHLRLWTSHLKCAEVLVIVS
uniref:Uncharacterized protein n=1 Tax=Anguilla anguilla TaxID=7936 RepID=A0A0E9S966_ANGAN